MKVKFINNTIFMKKCFFHFAEVRRRLDATSLVPSLCPRNFTQNYEKCKFIRSHIKIPHINHVLSLNISF